MSSLDHLGKSRKVKKQKKFKKIKCDDQMDEQTDRSTKRGVESRSRHIKIKKEFFLILKI